MKKSAHLVNVPGNSSDAEPLYYDELGEPVYAQTYAVQVNGINKNKHLIQLPVSVNLEKVRKPVEGPCPTILLKVDTGDDVNLLNSTTFDQIIGNRSILQPSALIWQFQSWSTWKVPCILEMERENIQATLLCDNSQFITQSTVQRCMLHFGSGETMLCSGSRAI